MCTANLLDKANNPEADFASLLFTARRPRIYEISFCLDFKYKIPHIYLSLLIDNAS